MFSSFSYVSASYLKCASAIIEIDKSDFCTDKFNSTLYSCSRIFIILRCRLALHSPFFTSHSRSTEQERKYKLSIFKSDLILFNSICTPLCRKSYITIILDIHVTFKYNPHFNRTVFIF